ncbi:MAG: methionine gamma-lyase family protein [Vulcanimicrobiota bacterium]
MELSCDGPLRPPYAVYLQGGISFEHIQIGVLNAIQEMKNSGFIK